MEKTNGPKTTKSKPIQTPGCEIKIESNDGLTMTGTGKIMLEIVCEKLMNNMDALFKRMGSHQEKSSYLDTYGPKKELLESLIYSNENNNDIQRLNQIEQQIVNKSFLCFNFQNILTFLQILSLLENIF